jgi:ketosteroid isomerase-like protein
MSELKETVERFWRAWCANDVTAMGSLLAESCVFEIVGGATLNGRAEFLAGNEQFAKTAILPGPKLTVHTIIAEGDVVMCTGSGEMVGAQTGLPYDNRYAWAFTFRDGLIARVEEYCDTKLLHEAIFGRTFSES